MSGEDIYMSREVYNKLVKEVEYLKTVRRRELSEEIARAREHGDLRENAEYDAAKDAQALNEKKIAELETKLIHTQVVDSKDIPKDKVHLWATVQLEDIDSGDELQYTLVSELEADFSQGKISVSSPVGKALLNHKIDEIVEISVPAGILKYKILMIK